MLSWIFNVLAHEAAVCRRLVTLPRHIILTLGQPVFALSPKFCVPSRGAATTYFNIYGFTRPGIKPHDLQHLRFNMFKSDSSEPGRKVIVLTDMKLYQ